MNTSDAPQPDWRIEKVQDGEKTNFFAEDGESGERIDLLSLQQTSPGTWTTVSFHGPDGTLPGADSAAAEEWARKGAELTLREFLNLRAGEEGPPKPSSTFFE